MNNVVVPQVEQLEGEPKVTKYEFFRFRAAGGSYYSRQESLMLRFFNLSPRVRGHYNKMPYDKLVKYLIEKNDPKNSIIRYPEFNINKTEKFTTYNHLVKTSNMFEPKNGIRYIISDRPNEIFFKVLYNSVKLPLHINNYNEDIFRRWFYSLGDSVLQQMREDFFRIDACIQETKIPTTNFNIYKIGNYLKVDDLGRSDYYYGKKKINFKYISRFNMFLVNKKPNVKSDRQYWDRIGIKLDDFILVTNLNKLNVISTYDKSKPSTIRREILEFYEKYIPEKFFIINTNFIKDEDKWSDRFQRVNI